MNQFHRDLTILYDYVKITRTMVNEVLIHVVVVEFEESLHQLQTVSSVSSHVIRAVKTVRAIAAVGASLAWSVNT